MFPLPVDVLPERRRNSSKRMARMYEQDPRSKSMTALQTVRLNFPVSEELRDGLRSSRRPPEVLSPLPSSYDRSDDHCFSRSQFAQYSFNMLYLDSPGLSSSSSNSPISHSPITPDVNDSATSCPSIHIANSNHLPERGYSRTPSVPSLRVIAREKAVIRRGTADFNLPVTDDSSSPYLIPSQPGVIRSPKTTVTARSSRKDSHKERRRYGLDFDRELSLAHKQILDEVATDRRRDSFLPSFHTQELGDAFANMSTSCTASSTYSVSLYPSEFDLEFPQPPLSPDIGAYKDCPMFTEQETCQVKKFLRNWRGANDSIEHTAPALPAPTDIRMASSVVDSSTPVPTASNKTASDLSWTGYWDGIGFGDFSWEAYDGSGDTDDKERGSSHDLLGKTGHLSDNGRNASPGRVDKIISASGLPKTLSGILTPVTEDLDEVSVVLTALRSSIALDDSGEQLKSSDDDADRDKTLWKELRVRLKPRSSLAIPQVPRKREDSVIHVASPAVVASKLFQERNVFSSNTDSTRTPARGLPPTLHSPKSSDHPGEACIALRYDHGAKDATSALRPRPSALDRLESSISKLQTHSPRQHQLPQSRSPPVPPKDRVRVPPVTHSPPNQSRRSDIIRKKPSIVAPLPMKHFEPKPRIYSHSPNAQAAPMHITDRPFHARSPSAPASVADPTMRPHLAPAFTIRSYAPQTGPLKGDLSQPTPPPLLKKKNREGFRSFMDITPEKKPRQIHARSRSSMAGAVFHAEKARKLLARASSSIASWSKGLARSGSRKG